jgi:hypothetical protein
LRYLFTSAMITDGDQSPTLSAALADADFDLVAATDASPACIYREKERIDKR